MSFKIILDAVIPVHLVPISTHCKFLEQNIHLGPGWVMVLMLFYKITFDTEPGGGLLVIPVHLFNLVPVSTHLLERFETNNH